LTWGLVRVNFSLPIFRTPESNEIKPTKLVPFAGIGPATSPLPRECSTTEPKGQKLGPTNQIKTTVERGRRIELLALAWKAKVLPLYEPRTGPPIKQLQSLVERAGFEPAYS
jgi:hypothetical protein